MEARVEDLFNRALSLGYDDQAAARVADCFDVAHQYDPCPLHKGHSTTVAHMGYAADGCEACEVIELSNAEGFTAEGFKAAQAKRAAEYAAIAAEEAAVTKVSPCGTWALGETVKHAEMGTGVIVYLGSVGGIEIEFPGGSTIGVDEAHYGEWSQVRTDDGPTLSVSQEAFAEAERDEMSGIEMIRELTAIPTGEPIQARRAPKLKAVHAADLGTGDDKTTSCGKAQVRGRVTMVPESVTCKLCKGTQRFQRWATSTTWRLREAEFARAGLRREMVIRETSGARRFGVIARIESGGIEIYFWNPDQVGKTYRAFATVAAFDEACEITDLTKMIKVGDRLVSVLGGESVVLGVTSTSVRYRQMGTATPVDVTASEFAAEISRGWLAIIPRVTCPVCRKGISNTQDHIHFGVALSWPGQPERPKGLYIRPDGTREAVTTDDVAELGMAINHGAGAYDNGIVVRVTWHEVTFKRNRDGSEYTLSLRDLLRMINRGGVTTYMPDAKGRPIGSWR